MTAQPRGRLGEPSLPPDSPRVPGFRSWRAVYVFVLLVLVLWIAGLAALPKVFS